MPPEQKRLVYIGMAALVVVLFVGGLLYGYPRRETPICKDGKPPLEQRDTGIGQVAYHCHDGQIVVK